MFITVSDISNGGRTLAVTVALGDLSDGLDFTVREEGTAVLVDLDLEAVENLIACLCKARDLYEEDKA